MASPPRTFATYSTITMPTSSSHYLATATSNDLTVPPLDADRFGRSYEHFCAAKRLKVDRELLNLRGRKVSLHSLHEKVMNNKAYDIREVRRVSRIIVTREGPQT